MSEALEQAVTAIIESDKVPVRWLRSGCEYAPGKRSTTGSVAYLDRAQAAAVIKHGAATEAPHA
jgi:hypothetical protein